MCAAGICRCSNSPWSSGLHMVSKSDGTVRPCGDYRRLNEHTSGDAYPIPHIHDFTAALAGCKIFSKVDLVKGYHQIPVHAEDVPKTAIVTPFGLFEFLQMPSVCLVCERHFFGHKVTQRGISPLPDKVEAVQQYERPRSVKSLQRFLRMINFYRRFLPNIAAVLQPLTNALAGAPRQMLWDKRMTSAFQQAKEQQARGTVIRPPPPAGPFPRRGPGGRVWHIVGETTRAGPQRMPALNFQHHPWVGASLRQGKRWPSLPGPTCGQACAGTSLCWAGQCEACATSKVARHTAPPVIPIHVSSERFSHVSRGHRRVFLSGAGMPVHLDNGGPHHVLARGRDNRRHGGRDSLPDLLDHLGRAVWGPLHRDVRPGGTIHISSVADSLGKAGHKGLHHNGIPPTRELHRWALSPHVEGRPVLRSEG